MLRYMLDTDTCIYVLRERDPKLLERFNRHADQVSISAITLAELRYGAENSQRIAANLAILDSFVARLAVLDFGPAAASHFARIRVALKSAPVGPMDMLIAAHARSADLSVVTGNTREFSRVPDLRIEDWRPPP